MKITLVAPAAAIDLQVDAAALPSPRIAPLDGVTYDPEQTCGDYLDVALLNEGVSGAKSSFRFAMANYGA